MLPQSRVYSYDGNMQQRIPETSLSLIGSGIVFPKASTPFYDNKQSLFIAIRAKNEGERIKSYRKPLHRFLKGH